jgi:hypothetical protein
MQKWLVHESFYPIDGVAYCQDDKKLGWEFQFLVPISGTPIESRILIPFSIPEIPVVFF